MSDYLDPHNEELLKDFFIEAELQIETLEQNILVLENDPDDDDAVNEIFRAAHTLKGAAGTVQMTQLSEFTHLVEDVLDVLRSKKVSASGDVVDCLLQAIDVIKEMLQTAKDGTSYEKDISELKENLRGILEYKRPDEHQQEKPGTKAAKEETVQNQSAEQSAEENQQESADGGALSEYDMLELREAAGENEAVYRVRVEFNENHPMNSIGGVQVFAALKDLGTVLKTYPDFETLYDDNFQRHVTYFVATEAEEPKIRKKLDMPDVVLNTRILPLEKIGDESARESSGVPASKGAAEEGKTVPREAPQKAAAGSSKGGTVETAGGAAQKSASAASTEKASTGASQQQQEPAAASAEQKESAEEGQKAPQPSQGKSQGGGSSSILRVDSARIDNLLNMVSEAVITKARFNQISNKFFSVHNDLTSAREKYYEQLKELFDSLPEYLGRIQNGEPVKKIKSEMIERFGEMYNLFDNVETRLKATANEFNNSAQNLSRTTSDLQEGVMQIRMVPISQIFNRFPRLVRDVSKDLQKKVKLEIQGEETELDKSVIDDLLDPLIHCVRNSIDHGLESPAEREEAGKPPEGHVQLRASNEGNMIIIEVEDDGRGIDVDSVYRKAVDNGLIHPNKKLSDVEAFNLIFEPGFSTSKEVTNLSGRGVGLDVVKRQIEKLNGSVSVWSQKGEGSRITIKIPLTLAIIQGLLIRIGKEVYAIPITSVIDSHRIKAEDIRMIDNYEVFNVREDVVSLMRLSRLFNIPTDENREYHYVVVVGSGEKRMGLMVDSLIGEEDVVIKPLKDKYTNSPGIAGATILGDGTVSLIIDVSQLLDLGLRREIENRKQRATQIT